MVFSKSERFSDEDGMAFLANDKTALKALEAYPQHLCGLMEFFGARGNPSFVKSDAELMIQEATHWHRKMQSKPDT